MNYQEEWVEKEVKIDVEGNEVKFTQIFLVKVDYCECKECGERLDFDMTSDVYGDLQIMVARCNCDTD